jgi:hypothetical protein
MQFAQEIVPEVGHHESFREAITISQICNKVLWTMFLNHDTVG